MTAAMSYGNEITLEKNRRLRKNARASFADADDAASLPGAGVSGGETELVSALAEIVDVGVNDDRASDNGKRAGERDPGVADFDGGDSVGAGFHVTQIAGVSNLVHGGAVGFAMRVEVAPGGGAAVGVVAEFVDVEAVRSFGQAAHFALNGDGSPDVGLRKVDDAFDHFTV